MISVSDSLLRLEEAISSGAVEELCHRYHAELLVLFGSALDSHTPGDIDIAVAFGPGHQQNILHFIDALADLIPGDNLDVMLLDAANPVALARALTNPRVLFARTPRAFYDRQTFAINHYIDTQHFRDAQLEALSR